jgi:hypothetical protein
MEKVIAPAELLMQKHHSSNHEARSDVRTSWPLEIRIGLVEAINQYHDLN